jgi:hypothetical protein
MTNLPDAPDIACALRTGFPPWMLPEESDEPDELDESPWPAILSNLEAYGNPAGPCLYELPPKGGTCLGL